jgi:histidine triad (HIT) family protein
MTDIVTDPNCLFCKIVAGQIPSRKVYEDDTIYAFHDINPVAPVHFLIIPKTHVASLADCNASHEAVLGKMLAVAGGLARDAGSTDGFRTIVNTGKVGQQEVYHLHIHIIGGPNPLGPMIRKV